MQILVWLIWVIACLAFIVVPEQGVVSEDGLGGPLVLTGVVTHNQYLRISGSEASPDASQSRIWGCWLLSFLNY